MSGGQALFAELRGFMKSRVVLTAAELDVFTPIGRAGLTAKALAAQKGLDERALTRLLDCLVTLGFLAKHQGVYGLTDLSRPLCADHPQTVLPVALHMNRLWDNWSGLTGLIKSGGAKPRAEGPFKDEATLAAFIGAMHGIGREMSEKIAKEYEASGREKLLDVGGGSGTYTMAFLRANPGLTAVIFDLPPVVNMARQRLQAEGLLDRVELVPGDFYADDLPKGCDLALASAIVHQNSPEENIRFYKKIFAALAPGGVILIRDHVMDAERTWPPAGAMFAINMLVNSPGGDTYTFAELRQGLEAAGFKDVRQVREGADMDSLVEARKPG
jgi:SAM-dependent methyltransferase